MSNLGTRWEIDGIPAAFITRSATNGRYRVTFERSEASLEQIEQINWSAPALTNISGSAQELGLPAGYGFTLVDLCYQHTNRIFIAELQTAQQYLGDVTGYQEEIRQLNETIRQQAEAVEQHSEQLSGMVSDMEQAYQEGVESNG